MVTQSLEYYETEEPGRAPHPRPDLRAILARRGKVGGMVFLVLLVTGFSLAFGLPPVYRSEAIILIEQQEIPPDLIRSTVTGFADQRVETIRQRVMTSTNLLQVIEKYDLYLEERKRKPREVVLDEMRDAIAQKMISADVVDPRSGRPTQATIAFSLAFESESASVAQKVANELVSLYLGENIKERSQSASETSAFLAGEARKFSKTITDLEKRLAEFKETHAGSLPELFQLTMQMLERAYNQLEEVDRQLAAAAEQEIFLRGQLAQTSPFDQLFAETGERILGPSDRLKVLETRLISLQASYSDQHPSIQRLKREIQALRLETGSPADIGSDLAARLEEARGQLAVARQGYGEEHPEVKKLQGIIAGLADRQASAVAVTPAQAGVTPDNPAYIELTTRLESVRANQAAYRTRRQELESRIARHETDLQRTPQVEKEYRKLVRDYDNALLKYREIKAKQMEAQLAQSLESDHKAERFTLIEPPLIPEEPVRPNRPALLLVSLLFGLVAGGGVMAAGEKLDPSIRSREELEEIAGELPLASVPRIDTRRDGERRRRLRICALLGGAGLLVGLALLFHLLVLPLDVAWYVALRRLAF